MKKIKIKYLIWTILIAVIIILINAKQINAEEYGFSLQYTTFKDSRNMFCLNKGQRFNTEYVSANKVDSTTEFNSMISKYFKHEVPRGTESYKNILTYIISSRNSYEKTSISSWVPQIAIWELTTPVGNLENIEDYWEQKNNDEVNKLLAEAYAYDEYCKMKTQDKVKEPKIEYNNDGSTFYVYYTEIDAIYSASSGQSGSGTYKDLIKVSAPGASLVKTEAVSNYDGYTHRDLYRKNDGVDFVEVEITYEIDRKSEIEIWETKSEPKSITEFKDGNKIIYERSNQSAPPSYFYKGCSLVDPCFKVTDNETYFNSATIPTLTGDLYTKYHEEWKNDLDSITIYRCCKNHFSALVIDGSEYYYIYQVIDKGTYYDLKRLNATTGDKKAEVQDILYAEGDMYNERKTEIIEFVNPVELTFRKEDFSGNLRPGATIQVHGNEDSRIAKIEGREKIDDKWCLKDDNNDGIFNTITVYPKDNSGEFELFVKELEAPTGYNKFNSGKGIILTVKYDTQTGKVKSVTSSNKTYIPDILETNSSKDIIIKNQPVLNNLKIIKTDKWQTYKDGDRVGELLRIPGVTFKIELTGVESMTGYEIATKEDVDNYPTLIYATTDENGEINLNGLVLKPNVTQITAKITEFAVPAKNTYDGYYYLLDDKNPITITITYSNGSWRVTGDAVNGTHISSDEPTNSGGNAQVVIKNQPYIDITGMVWNDGQTGSKEVAGPNGIKESQEKGLGGVYVRLYSEETGKSVAGREIYTKSEDPNKGTYSFTEIPKTDKGYRIIFNYDGINWQETKSLGANGEDSKVFKEYYGNDKVTRETFNDKFKTIENGKAISKDGTTTIPLSYTFVENKPDDINDNVSILNVKMDGKNPANGDKIDFQMRAITDTYYETTSNVDCGLVKKEVDLALTTDVKEATLTINDKTTTYNYQQIVNGELADLDLDKIVQNNSSTVSDEKVKYNLYLYSSDYNYRIGDYKTDVRGNNVPDNDNNNIADYEGIKNLEAYVTYNVILKNQTTKNARVDEFVYYYDEVYTPRFSTGDIINGYRVESIESNKITFKVVDDTTFNLTNPNYRVEIDLTFRIQDKDGILRVNETATNVAEITRYSTEGGLIDKDSEPGNGITNGKVTQYEDDTDEAKGLNIVLRTEETRTITGTVFDDTSEKDGILNNDNPVVNDVIVQLIEIKKIGGVYYEYIWQETKSGSSEVIRMKKDGQGQEKYTNSVQAGSGMYEFKDFIPGNYIIRFIYGDGKTYDVDSQEYKNVAKYNGQDYKSTIDLNYNRPWYNTSPYTAGESVARDNEARRLEVMAYSTTINKTNGEALATKNKDALEATWMSAETSRINIPVDDVVDAKTKTANNNSSSTTTSYDYTKNNTKVLFGDMNFGLALRPETKITLEKHITALKITPSGTGVQPIVDAKATSIESIVNGTQVTVQGVTQGLATIKSTATNRGFWQVATDVEELLQGAELEVEYTYVIRNDSEKDYLSKTLVEAYVNQDIKPYNEVLREIKDTVKQTMRNGQYSYVGTDDLGVIGDYLGISYYTGAEFNDGFVDSRTQMDVNCDGNVNVRDLGIIQQYLKGWDVSTNNRGDIYADGEINNIDLTLLQKYLNGWEIEDWGDMSVTVPSKVETFEEALNNDLAFNTEEATYFKKANDTSVEKTVFNVKAEGRQQEINTVVQNTSATTFLLPKSGDKYEVQSEDALGSADWSKKITLRTTLSTVSGGELGANLPSYIAEITQYSNAAGRKDMYATPGNLGYVHSDDTEMTMDNSNEKDEFWSESIIITKPTGEDKITPLQIVIVTTAAIATLGVGILLIKKFVLKK